MNTISQIRAHLGLTQPAMADGIGVSQASISNYENGKQEMPPGVAARLIAYAASLGTSLTYDEIYASEYSARTPPASRRATDPEPGPGHAGRTPPSRDRLMTLSADHAAGTEPKA